MFLPASRTTERSQMCSEGEAASLHGSEHVIDGGTSPSITRSRPDHHGSGPSSFQNVPVGPFAYRGARRTGSRAACWTVRMSRPERGYVREAGGLFAGHHPANRASQLLLTSLGFRYTQSPFGGLACNSTDAML